MSTDDLNMRLTIVSIVVTVISIGCSFWSFHSAKKANQYKKDTLQLKETMDMEKLLGKFLIESKYFQDRTRTDEWFRGIDANSIITPFIEVLHSFGSIYHLTKDPDSLKQKVHRLNVIVQDYTNAKAKLRKESNELILDISDMLQSEIHRNTNKIIK